MSEYTASMYKSLEGAVAMPFASVLGGETRSVITGGFAIDMLTKIYLNKLPDASPSNVDIAVHDINVAAEVVKKLGYTFDFYNADTKAPTKLVVHAPLTNVNIWQDFSSTPGMDIVRYDTKVIIEHPVSLLTFINARTDYRITGRKARPIDYERKELLTEVANKHFREYFDDAL